MITLIPAFGRDYKSKSAALIDYVSGKDFLETSSRLATSIADLEGQEVLLRYKGHTMVAHATLKDIAKAKAHVEAEKANRPAQTDEFEEWLAKVGKCVEEAIGLGIDDIPDQDYRAAYDAGARPSQFAAQILTEEFGI